MPGLVPVSYKEPSSEPDRKIDSQNQELQAQNQENEGRCDHIDPLMTTATIRVERRTIR